MPSPSRSSHPTMVSHAQPPEQSHRASTNRAPSVTSSSRTHQSRRHRSSRSHGGGSSYRPQNEFPNFSQTGDVEITVQADGHERRYTLHRLILSQNSGFFEASTSEEWAKVQKNGIPVHQGLGRIGENEDDDGRPANRPLRNGEKIRLRYELDWGNEDDEVPMLVQKQPQATLFGGGSSPQPPPVPNKPAPGTGFLRSMTNTALQSAANLAKTSAQTGTDSDIIRDYDNLFRIFYNYSPSLDVVNIAESYIQCKSLLNLADMYDALDVVGPRIDHHLLQFQGRLWKQIAKYPPSYLKLGYLARSKVIFGEAMIHVVGQWPSGSTQLRHTVPDSVLDIIDDKVDELADRKMRTEGKLFRISLTTAKGDRVTPHTAYTDWLALSMFRQWLIDNTTPGAPPPPPSAGGSQRTSHTSPKQLSDGSLYRRLSSGGSAYLNHEDCKKFVRLRPEDHSRETLRRFEKKMDEIKSQAKEIVRPLMKNYLELDVARDGGNLSYLTCTKIEEDDFPWD